MHKRSCPRRFACASLIAAALALDGCTFAPQRYTQPEIRANALAPGELSRGGLAILTPSTVTGQEEDRQTLALLFTESLSRTRPELRIVPLPEVLSAVNRNSLVDAYQHLYADYRLTGVFQRDVLARLGQATDTRYLGQLKLARLEQGAKGRFGLLGLSVLQTQYAHMRLFFQIWDAQTGAVIWEGIDELTISVETSRERAVTLRTIAEQAAADLAARLP
ncbi:MAG: hypothetical protein JNL33_04595 [Betaproteobacteria bacterium]|nr:hypothetical protein [Betaproteobacteria bacterium]MBL8533114.1 hypothetical protein [Betaproteobacteria bacterium]